MNRPCPNKVLCINDNPFANLSSEGPEVFYYTAYGYCCDGSMRTARSVESQVAANDAVDIELSRTCPDCSERQTFCAVASCPDGTQLTRVCTDTSQEDADALAAHRQAELTPYCDNTGDLYRADCACPDGSNSRTVYSVVSQAQANADCEAIPVNCAEDEPCNTPQTCVVTCPDGTSFYYTVPACIRTARTQEQANIMAYNLACERARQFRICLSNLQPFCCYEDRFRATVTATTVSPSVTWSLTSGALPTGLSLNPTGKIMAFSGTVTADGSFTFTLRATDENGNYAERTYTVQIIKISADDTGMTETALAPATVGVQYSNNFTYSGPTITNPVWSVVGGSLPSGLSLDATIGELGGISNSVESDTFTIEVTGTIGTAPVSCSREFTMNVVAAGTDVYAYFKLDESSPGTSLVDSVSAADLALVLGNGVSVPGKLSTAFQLGGTFNTTWINGPSTHWVFDSSFTIRFWFKPVLSGGGNHVILSTNQFDVWLMEGHWTPGEMTFSFIVDTDPGNATVDGAIPMTLGAWNHVVLWFEQGVGVGCVINDGFPEVGAGADPIYAYPDSDLTLQDSHFMAANAIDEIAIWKRKLSAAEIAYDYNSGNGRTYPNIP